MLNDEVRARGAGQAETQRRGRGDTNANLFATNVVKAWFIGLGDLSCRLSCEASNIQRFLSQPRGVIEVKGEQQ